MREDVGPTLIHIQLVNGWGITGSIPLEPLLNSHACLARCIACENAFPHFSQLKGFCPMCVRTWLFSVVAPTNVREQKPHLKGRSVVWETTCVRSSEELLNVLPHCPHWKGLVGWLWHTCICRATRWVKVLWHCWHCQEVNSLSWKWELGSLLVGVLWSGDKLSTEAELFGRDFVGIRGGKFFESACGDLESENGQTNDNKSCIKYLKVWARQEVSFIVLELLALTGRSLFVKTVVVSSWMNEYERTNE